MVRSSRQKSMRKNIGLKHIRSDGLRDPYRAFHPKIEYTVLKAHGTFSRTNNTLGHNLLKCTKMEIISSIFAKHRGMKLKITRNLGKSKNIWKLNSILLKNYEFKENKR